MDYSSIKQLLRGVALTAIAPLDKNDRVDEEAIYSLVAFLIERGINKERGF